ncbi:aldehyde dehydrogenase family protein [Petrachloros mirabilis]
MLSGPVKDQALRAMAKRISTDEEGILEANEKDVDALGKSFEGESNKERIKAAVARVRMTADDIKEMVECLEVIADQPDPVGKVTSRWERPDGLQVSRVRVPIGVIGIISEMRPLATVESIGLCLKSGNVSVFRGGPEWTHTHQAIGKGLREAAKMSGVPAGAWAMVERPEKDVAIEMIRSGKALDAIIPRGGVGLRKAVLDGARMPVLCSDNGITYL